MRSPTNGLLTNVLNARARWGDGIVWDTNNQLAFWVDTYNHWVHQFEPATGSDIKFEVGQAVSCIGLEGPDRLLIGLSHEIAYLDIRTGKITPLMPIKADQPNSRLSAGSCDPMGRFWIASMSEDHQPTAHLYRYDPDGSLSVMEQGLTTPSGLGWSPDQRSFYLADTFAHKIYVYDYTVTTGTIDHRRVLVDLTEAALFPRGFAIDADGCLWCAIWNGWCVICFDADGKAVLRVELPVPNPTDCAFGGTRLTDLYITTESTSLSQAEIQNAISSGDLFCLQTNTGGLPANHFPEIEPRNNSNTLDQRSYPG